MPVVVLAVLFLKKAGFSEKQVGAYLLAGLPGQSSESILESIKTVKEAGIMPIPAYYTPIPHTGLWKDAVLSSRYDLESDPIFTRLAKVSINQVQDASGFRVAVQSAFSNYMIFHQAGLVRTEEEKQQGKRSLSRVDRALRHLRESK